MMLCAAVPLLSPSRCPGSVHGAQLPSSAVSSSSSSSRRAIGRRCEAPSVLLVPSAPCSSFLSPQGCNVMEDQDLRDIGISDPQHRRKLLQAARSLPKVSRDGHRPRGCGRVLEREELCGWGGWGGVGCPTCQF